MDARVRKEVRSLLLRGEDAIQHRDYERASYHFRKAYTLDPGNVTAITNLGFSYAKQGRFSHAQKCFTTALDLDPDNSVAKKNLNILLEPDYQPHAAAYRRVRRVNPNEELFIRYMEWGNLQLKEKNFFAALQYFEIASVIHPDFIEPYMRTGEAYEGLNDPEKALEAYEEALLVHPADPVAQKRMEICRGNLQTEEVHPRERQSPSPAEPVFIPPAPPVQPAPLPEPPQTKSDEHLPLAPPATPPVPEPTSDDAIIQSILNQYGDLLSGTPQKAESASESTPPPEEPSTLKSPDAEVTEVTPSSPQKAAMKDDDIINSILQQYSDEIEKPKGVGGQDAESTEVHTGEAPLQGEEGCSMQKKEGIHVELTDNQKDALRELGNIGASHAATSLSTMLNTPIMLNVPEISIIDIDKLNQQIVQEYSAMGIFTMEGQTPKAGYVILHVPKESVLQMTSIMLGMPSDPNRELNEMDESAITEIGNIMVSAFLDGTAELLGIIMLPSPPRTIFDLPKNVFSMIINESNICFDNVVFFKTELICDEHELTANIFMIPNPPVLNDIVRMLEDIIESSAQ